MITIITTAVVFLILIVIFLLLSLPVHYKMIEENRSEIERLLIMTETIRCLLNDNIAKNYERGVDSKRELIALRKELINVKDVVTHNNTMSKKRDNFIADGVDALANHLKLEIRPFHIKEEKKGFKIVKIKK
jgi:hypothetical protein